MNRIPAAQWAPIRMLSPSILSDMTSDGGVDLVMVGSQPIDDSRGRCDRCGRKFTTISRRSTIRLFWRNSNVRRRIRSRSSSLCTSDSRIRSVSDRRVSETGGRTRHSVGRSDVGCEPRHESAAARGGVTHCGLSSSSHHRFRAPKEFRLADDPAIYRRRRRRGTPGRSVRPAV